MKKNIFFTLFTLLTIILFLSCNKVDVLEYDYDLEILLEEPCNYQLSDTLLLRIKFEEKTGHTDHELMIRIQGLNDQKHYYFFTETIEVEGEFLYEDVILLSNILVSNDFFNPDIDKDYRISASVNAKWISFDVINLGGAGDNAWFHLKN